MEEIIVNLHMHTHYSDGSGSHVRYCSGLRFIADWMQLSLQITMCWLGGFEGYFKDGRKKVLMLVGEEVHDQDRDPQKNHLLVFGADQEMATFADDPQALIKTDRRFRRNFLHCTSERSCRTSFQ